MAEYLFYRLNPVLISLALMVLMALAAEAGYRAAKRPRPGSETSDNSNVTLILGAVLTLLSLMLGFTYSMSQGRYEARRQLIIREANAIGTAYLRAETLPEPWNSEIQELLARYATLRVEMGGMKELTPGRVGEIDARSKELHDAMWSKAVPLARESPGPIVSLFLQSLNETIDLHADRLAAFRSHVPISIYLVLISISVVAMGLLGYYSGTRRRRTWILNLTFLLLVAAVLWMILDLDNPVRGTIRSSKQSLIDLQKDIGPPSGTAIR